MTDAICFRTLGRLDLTRGVVSLSLLRRRRPLAVFAYLAVSRAPFHSRDILQATFWPESDQERARHSLNAALYEIRRDLGAGVVVRRGNDEVGIARDRVWCDVRAFEEAIADGDWATALELYHGELIPGFNVRGAPAFDQWLDDERFRLRRVTQGAASELARIAASAGRRAEAAEWARRAVAISWDDEVVVQRSIQLLDGVGDRLGAIEMYTRFENHLKEEYAAEPSPETHRLITEVRARVKPTVLAASEVARAEPPARARGPVDTPKLVVLAEHRAIGAPSSSQPRAAARQGPASRRLTLAASFIVLAAAALALMRLPPFNSGEPRQFAQAPAVLISPFEYLNADQELSYLGPAITAGIAEQLATADAIELLAQDTYGSDESADGWMGARRGREVFLVRGNVLSAGGNIRVLVELIDANTGSILRANRLDRPADDLFRLIDDVAHEVAALLRLELGREIRMRRWRAGTNDVLAWELLQRAETSRQRAKTLHGAGSFDAAAIELAKADSLLAAAEGRAPGWVDPMILRIQVASDASWLSFVPPFQDSARAAEWLQLGIDHADRVLELDPSNGDALEHRGRLRHWSVVMIKPVDSVADPLLRLAESDLRTAVADGTARPAAWSLLSAIFAARGDFSNAYSAAQDAYESDAFYEAREEILVRLAFMAYEVGSDSVAWEWCARIGWATPRAAYCELNLLAWRNSPPAGGALDPWDLARRVSADSLMAAQMGAPVMLLVATALANRSLPDSARAVIDREIAISRRIDETLPFEASARLALGEADSASALLRRYVSGQPAQRVGILHSRRFVPLRDRLRDLLIEDYHQQ